MKLNIYNKHSIVEESEELNELWKDGRGSYEIIKQKLQFLDKSN